MSSITFSAYHLVIDNQSPDLGRFYILPPTDHFDYKDAHYIIKYLIEAECFWLYAKYGSAIPYSYTVYNEDTKDEEQNPRNPSQIETNKQVFALYSPDAKTLYVSGKYKYKLVRKYLQTWISKNITVKRFVLDANQFIEKINGIKSIKFVAKDTLFGVKRKDLLSMVDIDSDILGLDSAIKMRLKIDYRKHDNWAETFKRILNLHNENKIEEMVCVGHGEHDFENVFNADNLTKKFTIEVNKDEKGVYDPNEVRERLIERVNVR